jgi:DNA gyrase subunit A
MKVTSATTDIKEISDIRDETDLGGMKIVIDLKRGVNYTKLMDKLFIMTPLQDTFSCNFNVLINSKPFVLGVKGIISEWVKFRIDCLKKQLYFDINKNKEKLHLLQGLEKILFDIDKAISIIRNSKNEAEAISSLKSYFEIDDIQADFIANIKLININKDYILNKTKEVSKLKDDITSLENTYQSDKKIKNLIISQLKGIIKKYGADRKTEISYNTKEIVIEEEIEDYNTVFFFTKEGYLKKIPATSLRGNSEQRLKENDVIVQEISGNNLSDVLLFSNKGICYKLNAHEINDSKASLLGEYLPNLLDLANEEKIIKMIVTEDYKGYVLFAYKNGKVAKVDLFSYVTKQNRSKLLNAYCNESELVNIMYITENIKLLAKSNINKVLIFDSRDINAKSSRVSQGVNVLKSKNNSCMVLCEELDKVEGIEDYRFYISNIPAVGCYLRKDDSINIK